jgi:eukaryotic-like serine/threonine-protein kinase
VGNAVVFLGSRNGNSQLFIRHLDSGEAKPISGTEGAFCTPFFSPDGQWVGFVADAQLKKVPVNGGPAVVLSPMPGIQGASWEIPDTIVIASAGPRGLEKIPAAGGSREPLTTLDTASGERGHRWPQVLPGGNKVLYAAVIGENANDNRIVVQDLRTGERRVLVQGGTFPHYVPTGHLVYVQNGTLMAVKFDEQKMAVDGAPVPLGETVLESGGGAAQYGFSRLGSFVYVPDASGASQSQLVWVDRKGIELPLDAPPNVFVALRISPDNNRLAVMVTGATQTTWLYDLSRHTMTRFFSESEMAFNPIWSPDSQHLAFAGGLEGGISRKPASGSGMEELLMTAARGGHPVSWSSDGRFLTYSERSTETGWDIGVLPLDNQRKPTLFLHTRFNETTPMISPNGHWLAYTSNESGRYEIYVEPFPQPGEKFQISAAGGFDPVWSRDGRELFYRSGNKMMAVPVDTDAHFMAGKAAQLFEGRYWTNTLAGVPNGSFDVSLDGKRFLMIKPAALQPPTQINVVVNWFEDLKRKFQ